MDEYVDESLPLRERGLKFIPQGVQLLLQLSLPLRERGLKFPSFLPRPFVRYVAPPAGARIEITNNLESIWYSSVAPPRERGLKSKGALRLPEGHKVAPSQWERGLKFSIRHNMQCCIYVAPPVGAWIEI